MPLVLSKSTNLRNDVFSARPFDQMVKFLDVVASLASKYPFHQNIEISGLAEPET
jgi:hypothetical protein